MEFPSSAMRMLAVIPKIKQKQDPSSSEGFVRQHIGGKKATNNPERVDGSRKAPALADKENAAPPSRQPAPAPARKGAGVKRRAQATQPAAAEAAAESGSPVEVIHQTEDASVAAAAAEGGSNSSHDAGSNEGRKRRSKKLSSEQGDGVDATAAGKKPRQQKNTQAAPQDAGEHDAQEVRPPAQQEQRQPQQDEHAGIEAAVPQYTRNGQVSGPWHGYWHGPFPSPSYPALLTLLVAYPAGACMYAGDL